MPKVTYIEAGGAAHTVEVDAGFSLMEGSVLNDVPGIIGLCGGICSCATCHCYIGPDWAAKIPPPSDGELAALDRVADPTAESRLGCQIIVTADLDGLVLRLPSYQSAGEA